MFSNPFETYATAKQLNDVIAAINHQGAIDATVVRILKSKGIVTDKEFTDLLASMTAKVDQHVAKLTEDEAEKAKAAMDPETVAGLDLINRLLGNQEKP